MKEINGFKAFTYPMLNDHGITFEVGRIYRTDEKISYGTQSNYGFHFCQNIEDTFYYFKGLEIDVCRVIGKGQIIETTSESDKYNGRDMNGIYAASEIEIIERLDRKAIMKIADALTKEWPPMRLLTLLKSYKLLPEEVAYFNSLYSKDPDFGWNPDILDALYRNQFSEETAKNLVYKKD